MKLKLISISVLAASAIMPAQALTQAEVKRCNAMAASFAAKKAEITKAKSGLDEKVALVEEAGERWEAAEELKLASARNAKIASDAKAEWQGLKGEVLKEQMALQSKVQMLNNDVASFNKSCATKKN